MHRTGNWGPVALAIVHLKASDDVAKGYYCPPEDENDSTDDGESICLGAAMFFQEGRISRLIAASPEFGRNRIGRFKTIGGHAQIAILKDGQYLALLERTSDGYTWVPWQAALGRRQACIPADFVKTFAIELPPTLPKNEDGEICVRL